MLGNLLRQALPSFSCVLQTLILRKQSSHLLLTQRVFCLARPVASVFLWYISQRFKQRKKLQFLTDLLLCKVRGMSSLLPCCHCSLDKRHRKTLSVFFFSSFSPPHPSPHRHCWRTAHTLQPVVPASLNLLNAQHKKSYYSEATFSAVLPPHCSSQHDITGQQAFRESVQSTEKG